MCRQRCALIVAPCACACACMSARVNACSSTAGLDLTTSSGDHRARAPQRHGLACGAPPRPNFLYVHGSGTLATSTASPTGLRRNYKPPECDHDCLHDCLGLIATSTSSPERVYAPCHGFALETKSDDPSTQNRGVQKRAPLPPEPFRVRPCHGFAPLETKSDDPSTQKRGVQKRRRYRQSI